MSRDAIDFVPESVGVLRAAPLSRDHLVGAAVQGIYVCLPKPLAGMGTNRQLQGVVAGVKAMTASSGIDFGFIGPAIPGADPCLEHPLAEIPAADTVAGSYRRATAAFTAALRQLEDRGLRRLAVLCMGYTAYGPESLKRAVRAVREEGRRGPERLDVFIIDSAYPDTDRKESALDAEGWPASRFYTPAFQSDETIRISFLLTSAYDYNAALLNQRCPEGLTGVSVVAPPYTDDYLAELEADGDSARARGVGVLSTLFPEVAGIAPEDLLVPLVSSDVWSEDAVGVWMTREAHRSCTRGTESIARALVMVSGRVGRRIWMPIDTAGADFLIGLAIDGLRVSDPGKPIGTEAAVVLVPYRGLPQSAHTTLLGAAHLAVSRTGGQANATCVLGLTKTPNVVIDMPACGYMQSELTSLFMTHSADVTLAGGVSCEPLPSPLGWRGAWHWSPEDLAELLESALIDISERGQRSEHAIAAFHELKRSTFGSVFGILELLR